jgi:hypothetical protein
MSIIGNMFKRDDTDKERVEKLIAELNDIQKTIVEFSNNKDIDQDIAIMIGSLRAQRTEDISQEKIVEFLAYLSDKTKTKTDSIQANYTDTMRRIIHAKIKLLYLYYTSVSGRTIVSQVLSIQTAMALIVLVALLIGILIGVHKVDPTLFNDIGISSREVSK